MTPRQRLNVLLELVSERGNVTISEIGDALDVSPATARRDLASFADHPHPRRGRRTGYELPLQYKTARQAEAKTAIAARAADLVRPGETVGSNGGTTTTEVARALGKSERFVRTDGDTGLTVVTKRAQHRLRAACPCAGQDRRDRRQSCELVGPLVSDALSAFALDTVILGVDGLSAQYGATKLHEGEADVRLQLPARRDRRPGHRLRGARVVRRRPGRGLRGARRRRTNRPLHISDCFAMMQINITQK
ncbi:DeoR family transcriptional regulator [Amycolatopsis halotolerans]|uniref:DeoR family transcriptional regulator n=1 Tax=Amycolatopsis halotolerans TaxID=330083 RepID=A0ABV7QRV1_9PSEU